MKDDDIRRLLRSRDESGLVCLLDRYGWLITYIVRNTGITHTEDIPECISDILFAVWKRIKKFDSSKSSFKTWLVLVSRGCAIDFLRKNKRYGGTVSLEDVKVIGNESSALNRLLSPDLIQMLQMLPPPDNEIFYRRFILGETVTGIADNLSLTQDAVYKRIMRGKSKLKALMEKEGYYYV